jgi:hypothetical protein
MDVEEEYNGFVTEASVADPSWPSQGERDWTGAWEHYVSDCVREMWPTFTVEQKMAIAKMAEEFGRRVTAWIG